MPADTEFKYSELAKHQMVLFYRQLKQEKCVKEGLFNGSFAGLAGFALGFVYYNNKRQAVKVIPWAFFAGYVVTGLLCQHKVSEDNKK